MGYKTTANQRSLSRQDWLSLSRSIRDSLVELQALSILSRRLGIVIDGLDQLIEGLRREDLSARLAQYPVTDAIND